MLSTYLTRTRRLLQNPPSASVLLYTDADLTDNINQARGQLAGDAECVLAFATMTTTINQRAYPFPSFVIDPTQQGIAGIFHARQALMYVGQEYDGVVVGRRWIRPRSWPWFTQYFLNNVAPIQGPPSEWSQYGQGSTGNLYLDPLPNQQPGLIDYTVAFDCSCLPVSLVDDTTPEAIPYPFTDAVPFLAAYYALLSAQSAARQADADRMFTRYEEFRNRARKISNPSILPYIYEQSGNPVRNNQLGIGAPAGGAAGAAG